VRARAPAGPIFVKQGNPTHTDRIPGTPRAAGAGPAASTGRETDTRAIMKTLQLQQAYTILRLTDTLPPRRTLTEQVQPYIPQSPLLILDVDGIQFSSMLIGEIVNVHRNFEEHWKGQTHQFSLVNLSDVSRAVFERVRLTDYFPIYGSLSDAVHNGAH
jgi:anti-anti-sigma regulatory factor